MATTNAATKMSTVEERKELDARARSGQIVVPGGKGGKSLLAQEKLAEGRMKGGKTRREQLGINGYKMMGKKGGQTRKEQLGTEGYRKLGRLGGLSNFATRNEPKSGLAIKSEPTSTSASPEPTHGSTSAATSLDPASTPALPSNCGANEN